MLRYSEMQGETELHGGVMVKCGERIIWVTCLCSAVSPQVGNVKKETTALWYKDGREIKANENLGFTEGVLKLEIAQVRKL